ncbi:hypothetical protein BGZ61DRAFT_226929 [Ilyonectria robusta]|uniref:uncharacterized protein n=1 Tax=Ilyonectria robusta TaxID=1079257 RepID=UPI001E8CCC18|nr:uncharacterized protein BGZ61DRAFT_226929 [Ilyonectria robusta]KAH8706766.1 hypothetical protein BGZ61DRAFT_226929 [Ilyonectria robusta]
MPTPAAQVKGKERRGVLEIKEVHRGAAIPRRTRLHKQTKEISATPRTDRAGCRKHSVEGDRAGRDETESETKRWEDCLTSGRTHRRDSTVAEEDSSAPCLLRNAINVAPDTTHSATEESPSLRPRSPVPNNLRAIESATATATATATTGGPRNYLKPIPNRRYPRAGWLRCAMAHATQSSPGRS